MAYSHDEIKHTSENKLENYKWILEINYWGEKKTSHRILHTAW